MVNGRSGVESGVGPVSAIWRRTGVTSSSTPAIAPISRDHAPAAHTTVDVRTVPCVVPTAAISPPRTSMPVTAQPVTNRAPRRRASSAYAHAASSGRACPSMGQKAAATNASGSIAGQRARASAASSITLGMPTSFCSATPASKRATSSASRRRNR